MPSQKASSLLWVWRSSQGFVKRILADQQFRPYDSGFSALAVGHPKISLDSSSVLEQQLTTELDPSAEVRRQRLGRNLGRDSES